MRYMYNVVMIPWARHGEPACVIAKKEELQKLKDFQTYELVDDLGQLKISTRWVLSDKNGKIKARLVARGFEEDESIQKNSPTVCKSSVRVILAVAASRNWVVKTTDIKSAFLQGKKLERNVFLDPPREACEPEGKIWKLNHCLYGLNDAARQFYQSVRETLLSIGCQQSIHDPAVFTLRKDGRLLGVVGCHIDDFLHTGDTEFDCLVMDKLRERFLAGRVDDKTFTYVGFGIKQCSDGIKLDQSDYVENLENVALSPERESMKRDSLTSSEHTLFRSVVGRLNWAVQGTRPDLAFEMVDLSTRFKTAVVADFLRAKKAFLKLKCEPSIISFPDLGDPMQWKLVVFSDAALANLSDGVSSTGAHIVFMVGNDNKACPLSWAANKVKRVVRSTIAAEALSLLEGCEDAIYLKDFIVNLLGCSSDVCPVYAIVDNKSVVDALGSTRLVDDKRLRLDISAIQQAVERKEITQVKWCPGEHQLANCLTKKGASSAKLLNVLRTGRLRFDM